MRRHARYESTAEADDGPIPAWAALIAGVRDEEKGAGEATKGRESVYVGRSGEAEAAVIAGRIPRSAADILVMRAEVFGESVAPNAKKPLQCTL